MSNSIQSYTPSNANFTTNEGTETHVPPPNQSSTATCATDKSNPGCAPAGSDGVDSVWAETSYNETAFGGSQQSVWGEQPASWGATSIFPQDPPAENQD